MGCQPAYAPLRAFSVARPAPMNILHGRAGAPQGRPFSPFFGQARGSCGFAAAGSLRARPRWNGPPRTSPAISGPALAGRFDPLYSPASARVNRKLTISRANWRLRQRLPNGLGRSRRVGVGALIIHPTLPQAHALPVVRRPNWSLQDLTGYGPW